MLSNAGKSPAATSFTLTVKSAARPDGVAIRDARLLNLVRNTIDHVKPNCDDVLFRVTRRSPVLPSASRAPFRVSGVTSAFKTLVDLPSNERVKPPRFVDGVTLPEPLTPDESTVTSCVSKPRRPVTSSLTITRALAGSRSPPEAAPDMID